MVEKVLAGFGVVVPRVLPDIKSDLRAGESRDDGRRTRRGGRYGGVTGRHKVPFVTIKTSGTEYVRRYKEKRKRARERGRDEGMERWRGIGRRSSYDRTDRSDGPGFPLNSQYMIPGNQNEPAFTTSRGGTFPDNDTIEPQTRASSEETTKVRVGALVLTKLGDAVDIYVHRACV